MVVVDSGPQISEREIKLRELVRTMLHLIGENPEREGLEETPRRVAAAWLELTRGYAENPALILERTFNSDDYDEMVILRQMEFYSACEHHLIPFHGVATIAYIPDENRIVGLSKLARLVDCFAHRLQVQERLTTQIANAIDEHLKPKGVAVLISAKHLCMCMRGVRKGADTVTSCLRGVMLKPEVRSEFLALAQNGTGRN